MDLKWSKNLENGFLEILNHLKVQKYNDCVNKLTLWLLTSDFENKFSKQQGVLYYLWITLNIFWESQI